VALRARYLADKSALARYTLPPVAARLTPLMDEGLIATCAIVDLEVLYSARRLGDYQEVLEERRALDAAPITPAVMATAIDLQHELARIGQHRVPIPELVIAAGLKTPG
jgi:predicted nucleic acid-binding protein